MIRVPAGRIWIAAGITDMRKGFDGLAAIVQETLEENPFSGQLFVFRGKRGDLVKMIWWDGDGLCLFAKRLERGRFIWPQAANGSFRAESSPAIDVARGHRLATPRTNLATAACRIERKCFKNSPPSPTMMT